MNFQGQQLKIGFLQVMVILWALLAGSQLAAQGITVNSTDRYDSKTASGKHKSTKISFDGLNNFNIEYRGDIKLNDTDTEVVGIAPGGYLEISKTTFGSKREVIIEPKEGKLIREYYEGRRQVDFEPDGRRWLAEILPDIVRSTGLAAESRIERFYKKGGVSAVMDEVSRLKGSYVQSIYGKILLNKRELTKSEVASVLEELSENIDSDYYKAEMLGDVRERFLADKELTKVYFKAVENIDSDYYAASVLTKSMKDIEPDEELFETIMRSCANIGSDYYHAEVLGDALKLRELNDGTLSKIIASTREINSDYYQAQVLSDAMQRSGLSKKSYDALIEAVGNVDSDYYMAEVFDNVVERDTDEETVGAVIRILDDKMSSDYYKSAVLAKLASHQTLSESNMEKLSMAIAHMSSSTYAAEIITKASRNRNMTKATLIALIKSCENINSDYYKADALESLADQVRSGDDEVKEAYRKAASSIGSTHYYGQAMRAIH